MTLPTHLAGVNLAGYFYAESGVGEVARLMQATLEAAGVPYSTILFDLTRSRQERVVPVDGGSGLLYDINLVCVNADQTPIFLERMGADFVDGRYTIGVWAWEVDVLPPEMRSSARLVQEVWGISRHTASSVAPFVDCPVHPFTLPVNPVEPAPVGRDHFDLPDRFLFFFCFDFDSVAERKNVQGLIKAFRHAFEPGEGPVLLLKSINGQFHREKLAAIRQASQDHPDILVRDGYLSAAEQSALTGLCDAYVSLHRAEGFGLTIAEAMAAGKPVVATAYSGNLDFMDSTTAYLVPYDLVQVPPDCDPYPTTARWAEPRLDEAAAVLRSIWESPEAARATGERAAEHIRRCHTPEARVGDLRRRLGAAAERATLLVSPASATARSSSGGQGFESLLESLLAAGPDVNAKSVLGPVGPWLRRAVLRLIRPYYLYQERVNAAILSRLQSWRSFGVRLEENLRKQIDRLERSLRELDEKTETIGSELSHSTARTEELTRSVQAVERAITEQTRESEAARAGAKTRLDAVVASLSDLVAELYAHPYLADPSLNTPEGGDRWSFSAGHGEAEPDLVYRRFEDVFRGTEDFIRERQRPYLDLIGDRSPVLDVGCGRGEMLDLLREVGIEARGVDADPGMVRRCREKGHEVVEADAVGYLRSLKPGGLGAIFCAQVLEHLPYQELVELLRLAADRLQPGGVLIAETVNPHALSAFKAFWVDPTHRAPLFPETLLALARFSGFHSGRILFPLGTGDFERDRRRCGEYALIAYVDTRD